MPPDPILLDLPTHLKTERLILRPPAAGDGPAHFEAVTESLQELRRFYPATPWLAENRSVESSEFLCRNAQVDFLTRKYLLFLLHERATGEFLGTIGLHHFAWETPKAELGYWCRVSKTGNGFVSEAVQAVVEFAFTTLGMIRIEVLTDEDNHAARRVAERCGFQLEGTMRNERRAFDGSLRNSCLYARLHA